MRIMIPTHLPNCPETAVLAELTMAAGPGNAVTVGWSIRSLTTMQPLSIGATPPCTRQHLEQRVLEVQSALGEAVASLLDWPPFP